MRLTWHACVVSDEQKAPDLCVDYVLCRRTCKRLVKQVLEDEACHPGYTCLPPWWGYGRTLRQGGGGALTPFYDLEITPNHPYIIALLFLGYCHLNDNSLIGSRAVPDKHVVITPRHAGIGDVTSDTLNGFDWWESDTPLTFICDVYILYLDRKPSVR